MEGAVPGKILRDDSPILIWDLPTLVIDGHVRSYAVISHPEDGRFETLERDFVSVDWRLVDNAWQPLYDDGETTEIEVETETDETT